MTVEWTAAAAEYIDQRRARGYKLRDQAVLLQRFGAALQAAGAERITVADVMAFAQHDPEVSLVTHARRFGVIRAFATWVGAVDSAAAEPIPPGLIRGAYQRRNPYLYSPGEVRQLMTAARELPEPWLAEAMYVLIGLLSVTGLRSGEAFNLNVEDFDASGLVVRVQGKLDRPRLVPLHPSTAEELSRYCTGRSAGPLLVARQGRRLPRTTAYGAFHRLLAACGIVSKPGARPARLHDFRHTFAVDTLTDAHRQRLDVDARVAVLSTFLGHREPINTYWYLTASAELMTAVSDRMAAALGRRPR